MRKKNFIIVFLFALMTFIGSDMQIAKAEEIEMYFKQGESLEYENNDDLDDKSLKITLDEFQQNIEFYKKSLKDNFKQKTTVVNGLEIIETDFDWNGDLDLTNNPKMLALHHIEASRSGQTIPVTDVHKWHLANGWTGIGYHFYITKTGKIYRGRPENAIGAHVKGFNRDSIGIAVEGRYELENMPAIQRNMVEKLGGYLRTKYDIETIKGHGELIPTSCPGDKYPLNGIRANIGKYPIYYAPKVPNIGDDPAIQYVSYVENEGWQNWKRNSEVSGSTGLGRRVEGIKIKLANLPNSNVTYRTYVEKYGWMPWVKNGETSGLRMENKKVEAVQIKLDGEAGQRYDIEYRTHVQNIGWLPWNKNGQVSGLEGQGKRVEAIEIRLVEKTKLIEYKTHVQDHAWMNWVSDGQLSGTEGQSKRVEAMIIKVNDEQISDLNLRYRVHVQDYGWMPWVNDGEMVGTEGESKRIEAIQIEVLGDNPKGYQIEYRTHVQDYGWMPWVKNGQISGTEGQAKRVEAIEVRIKQK